MSDLNRALIDGARVKRLIVHADERGRLFEILRRDEGDLFRGFGQAYVTTTYPGVVKAWHSHRLQDDYLTCIRGMIKLVMFDNRDGSPTRGQIDEHFVGEHRLTLVVVPRGVWHGWKCISEREAMILNLPTEPYDHQHPDELRLDPHASELIRYDWARKDG